MPEYYESVVTRYQQTQGVWTLAPTFKVGKMDKAAHIALNNALNVTIAARTVAQNTVDLALAARDSASSTIRVANLGVAGLIDASYDDDHPLVEQLDEIYGIDPGSESENLRRAGKLAALWKLVNAEFAAQTPPLAPLTRGALTLAAFQALVANQPTLQQNLENERATLSTKRNAIRTATRALDKANKKWFKAWSSTFNEGSPEREAMAQIDTGDAQSQPDAWEIAALTKRPDNTVLVSFVPGGGDGASQASLLFKIAGTDADFAHETPLQSAGQLIGPFTAGQSVSVVTRASNSAGTTQSAAVTVVV